MTKFPDTTMRLRDVIVRGRGFTPEGVFTRVVTFPQIAWKSAGAHCSKGTYRGIYQGATVVEDPMLAYLVDLIRYGYMSMGHYTKMREGKEWNPPDPRFEKGYAPEMNVAQLRSFQETNSLKHALSTYKDGRLAWPTFSVGRRGTRGSHQEGGLNAVTMTYLQAIQFGASILKQYDNEIPDFRPDDSYERLAVVKKHLENVELEVVEDSGWVGRSGGSCITDYTRNVTFNMAPTLVELALYEEMLSLDRCPGWTQVSAREITKRTWQFSTTMDSSD